MSIRLCCVLYDKNRNSLFDNISMNNYVDIARFNMLWRDVEIETYISMFNFFQDSFRWWFFHVVNRFLKIIKWIIIKDSAENPNGTANLKIIFGEFFIWKYPSISYYKTFIECNLSKKLFKTISTSDFQHETNRINLLKLEITFQSQISLLKTKNFFFSLLRSFFLMPQHVYIYISTHIDAL